MGLRRLKNRDPGRRTSRVPTNFLTRASFTLGRDSVGHANRRTFTDFLQNSSRLADKGNHFSTIVCVLAGYACLCPDINLPKLGEGVV